MVTFTERVEAERINGYREPGELYLVGTLPNFRCCKGPVELPKNIVPKRGLLPVPAEFYLTTSNNSVECSAHCPAGLNYSEGNTAGMIWVPEKHYQSAAFFVHEARSNPIQVRIKRLHCGIVPGKSWVLLAHRKTIVDYSEGMNGYVDEKGNAHTTVRYRPGIFTMFRVDSIEYVLGNNEIEKASGVEMTELQSLVAAGVKLIKVIREADLAENEYPEETQQGYE
jgi:hypothetical protein